MRVEIETAKLAQEKGFDVPVLGYYFENFMAGMRYILVDYIGPGQFGEILIPENHNLKGKYELNRYSAPTQEELSDWLKYEHGIHVSTKPTYWNKGDERNGQYEAMYYDLNDLEEEGTELFDFNDVGYATKYVRDDQDDPSSDTLFENHYRATEAVLNLALSNLKS